MYYLIYKITNKINNKIYIGKHKTLDKEDDYFGSGNLIKRAIKKYGTENFTKEIIFECSSEQEMNDMEAKIVNEEFIARLDTYNIKLGGDGGFSYINNNNLNMYKHHSDVSRQNIKKAVTRSLQLRSQKESDWYIDYQQKIINGLKLYYQLNSGSFTGKKHSDLTKHKISEKNKKLKGERNSQFGTCWITKDGINKKIKKEELQSMLEKGYKKGRIIKH